MCIGAHTDDEKEIEKSFITTKKLFDQIKNASVLSMGMSDDFELAIACGANLLRIGSFCSKSKMLETYALKNGAVFISDAHFLPKSPHLIHTLKELLSAKPPQVFFHGRYFPCSCGLLAPRQRAAKNH